jgi:hypothetical protein
MYASCCRQPDGVHLLFVVAHLGSNRLNAEETRVPAMQMGAPAPAPIGAASVSSSDAN